MLGTFTILFAVVALSHQAYDPVLCPDDEDYVTTYIIDPTNCRRFYECSKGMPYLFNCPRNTVFDSYLDVCVYSEDGQCLPEVEHSAYSVPKVVKSDDGPNLAKECPPEDGKYPTFLVDPTDCSRFYECSHGKPFLLQCPKNMLFNTETLTCDRRENVDCNRNFQEIIN